MVIPFIVRLLTVAVKGGREFKEDCTVSGGAEAASDRRIRTGSSAI
jgi:hypothetical protein